MSHDPVRLRDDRAVSSQLRLDLKLSAAAPVSFDVDRALERFNQTVATGGVGASNAMPRSSAILRPNARWWGTAAIGLASLLAALSWGRQRFARRASVEVVASREARSAAGIGLRSSEAAHGAVAASDSTHPAAGSRTQSDRGVAGLGTVMDGTGGAPANAEPTSRAGRNELLVAMTAGSNAHASREGTLTGATSAIPHFERSTHERSGSGSSPRTLASTGATGDGSADLLHRERSQLTDAYAQFERNPAGALALTAAGNREFANGRHVEEREALAIRALASLRRDREARMRAQRFLERYPHGAWSGLIREFAR